MCWMWGLGSSNQLGDPNDKGSQITWFCINLTCMTYEPAICYMHDPWIVWDCTRMFMLTLLWNLRVTFKEGEKTYCSILIKYEGLGKKSHHYVPFRTRTKRVKKIKMLEKAVLIYKWQESSEGIGSSENLFPCFPA